MVDIRHFHQTSSSASRSFRAPACVVLKRPHWGRRFLAASSWLRLPHRGNSLCRMHLLLMETVDDGDALCSRVDCAYAVYAGVISRIHARWNSSCGFHTCAYDSL